MTPRGGCCPCISPHWSGSNRWCGKKQLTLRRRELKTMFPVNQQRSQSRATSGAALQDAKTTSEDKGRWAVDGSERPPHGATHPQSAASRSLRLASLQLGPFLRCHKAVFLPHSRSPFLTHAGVLPPSVQKNSIILCDRSGITQYAEQVRSSGSRRQTPSACL